MREIYHRCGNGRDWDRKECFQLVFPITFTMPDGSIISVTSDDEEGWSDLKDWYEENSDSEERPTLHYPVEIVYETDDGDSLVTIDNEEEMIAAKQDCWEDWGEDRPGPVFFDALGRLNIDSYIVRDETLKE